MKDDKSKMGGLRGGMVYPVASVSKCAYHIAAVARASDARMLRQVHAQSLNPGELFEHPETGEVVELKEVTYIETELDVDVYEGFTYDDPILTYHHVTGPKAKSTNMMPIARNTLITRVNSF